MFNVKISLFARTKDLEHTIDSLHDKIIEMTLEFREAVDTEAVVNNAQSDIRSTDAESDSILTRGERRVNSIVNNALDDAENEPSPAETQTTEADENSTDDENKKKLL